MAVPRLTILLALWTGWRPLYDGSHVKALCKMLREHLRVPFQVVLQTNQEIGPCGADCVVPLPFQPQGAYGSINCFRRLRYFDPEYSSQFGTDWVMSLDIDTLILGDITGAVEHAMNPFGFCVIRGRYADRSGRRPYNGSIYTIRVGEHAHVWQDWDWIDGPIACKATGWRGSDQVWLSLKLPGAPTLGPEHGVYFLEQYLQSSDSDPDPVMLNYAGPNKPWSKTSKRETPELWQEYQRYL